MPRGDRTGPTGLGPMTGRGAGYCAGYPVPGFMSPAPGRGGGGRGRGGGGGGWRHRHWYHATGLPGWQRAASGWPGYAPPTPGAFGPPITKEQELAALKNQAKHLEQVLDDLQKRIREVESSAEGPKTE